MSSLILQSYLKTEKKAIKRIALKLLSCFSVLLFFSFGVNAQNPIISDTVPFIVERLDKINSQRSDMAGVLIDDVLYFSSLRNASQNKKDKKQGSIFYELYKVNVDENGNPIGDISKNGLKGIFGHDVINSYCQKTGEIFVSRSNMDDPEVKRTVFKKKEIRIRIVILKKLGDNIVVVKEFPYNNSLYNVAHPAISSSGDTLYFSSDKNGKNMDLYYSVRKDGAWGVPVRLDDNINNHGNELFPYVDKYGTLYFTSDGHKGGKGGLDIWFATRNASNGFNSPVLFKNGLNSTADDFSFFMKEDADFGYFSSNRGGNNENDCIYKVKIPYIKGRVIDYYSRMSIQDALVDVEGITFKTTQDGTFVFMISEGNDYKLTATKELYDTTMVKVSSPSEVLIELKGRYFLHLTVIDEKTGKAVNVDLQYNDDRLKIEQTGAGFYECELGYNKSYDLTARHTKYFIANKTISTQGKPYGIINDTIFMSNTLSLNILYDYNSAVIRPDAAAELDGLVKYLEGSPDLKIELGAHTDTRGTDEYNLNLSERRAKSAIEYIISKGISEDRVSSKGYGKSMPVIHCEGSTCTEEIHQKNRRTEIRIITDEDGE